MYVTTNVDSIVDTAMISAYPVPSKLLPMATLSASCALLCINSLRFMLMT